VERQADLPLAFSKEDLEGSISQRFERIVQYFGERLALIHDEQKLTYSEINVDANRIAHWLLTQNEHIEKPVALLFGHNISAIVTILGVLKAGKAYCVLDPAAPAERSATILADLQCPLILADQAHLTQARQLGSDRYQVVEIAGAAVGYPATNPQLDIPTKTLAAIYYTSGSTGQPKGVERTHWHNIKRAQMHSDFQGIQPHDVLSMINPLSFASSAADLYTSILSGAALCIYDIKHAGFEGLTDWIVTHQVTQIHLPNTVLRTWLESLANDTMLSSLRSVRPSFRLYRTDIERLWKHLPNHATITHSLNATEIGPVCRIKLQRDTALDGDIIPVGYPVPGVEIMLIDDAGQPVAQGEVGEIIVNSPYVQRYWRRPELNNEKFIPDPTDSSRRIYHLGDLGRLRPDGCLELVGRKDFQVKIRGFRVEIEEVETALERLQSVKQATVIAESDALGEKRLIAYVATAGPGGTSQSLRTHLRQVLPEYAIPARFVLLERLPLLANGKVDRKALPPPGAQRPELDTPHRMPGTPAEEVIAAIWSDILGIDGLGIDDPFFDLGGDSISAARIVMIVQNEFQSKLPLPELLRQPTIAHMAQLLVEQPPASARQTPPSEAEVTPSTLSIKKEQPSTPQRRSTLRRWAGHAILGHGPAVGPFVLPYAMGVKMQRAWLQLPFIRDGLLQRRSNIFRHCLDQMQIPDPNGDLLTLHLMATSWQPWRIKALAPAHHFAKWVTVLGREHLVEAQQDEQRGVIVLFPHAPVRAVLLGRVVKQYLPREKCSITLHRRNIPQTPDGKSIVLTRDLLRAIGILQRHGVVWTTGDAFHGRAVLTAPFYGRLFPFRGGYAELAVQTGARVLPVFPYLTSDGYVMLDFAPPLEAGAGSVAVQVEEIVRQYADLLSERWPQQLPSMSSPRLKTILDLPGL
jgi:amino acid adenylation domain-containing protein